MAHNKEHLFECRLRWSGAAQGPVKNYEGYSREYRVDFAGKPALVGSAAPDFRGDPALHNPEDLLVAALSACHMLTYLAVCAKAGVEVIAYEDEARGVMAYDPAAKVIRFTEVMLRPRVTIRDAQHAESARALHDKAHHGCFIANSVNFPVRHEATVRVESAQ